jgi:hypothetical protein
MPTYRSIPARITVNPDSTAPLAAGLELTPVYYSNKVTALVRSIDSSNPSAGKTSRRADVTNGIYPGDARRSS